MRQSGNSEVKRTERGWIGHFISAGKCRFRRNTLLECGDTKIVVSTVGLMTHGNEFEELSAGRYFETMAFHADPADTRYHDADVTRQVKFSSPCGISCIDADDEANEMHEHVVAEITGRMKNGRRLG